MACRYAGIDWATEKHDVLVADETGAEVVAATFAHDEKGLSSLCRTLVRLDVCLVAIERPDGLLVERLLERGCGCWRCIRTRSRPRATGSGSRAGSPTDSTRSCCASSRAPTITASVCSNRTPIRFRLVLAGRLVVLVWARARRRHRTRM
jgi:hypothetical protein